MEDGRLPLTNNLCESHIRPFATARWAWLFADPPRERRPARYSTHWWRARRPTVWTCMGT
ncbi:MAG: transposase [Lachnospiraceae bacterium]|nr:transposase [Lachnospiraceae bacterium]